jgi:transcriptional regulator with XRE-family HTH domain
MSEADGVSTLRRKREEQGWGLREAAAAAQITAAHLSMVERGQRRLSAGALDRLVPLLGLGPRDVAAVMREMVNVEERR